MNNYKIVSLRNRCIMPNFEYIQSLQLSPSGQFIALSSVFGNKIHIYYVENLILKECFYLGDEINDIKKMTFPGIGEEFLIIQINKENLRIYKFSNILEGQFKCRCYKYKNEDLIKEEIKKKENEGWFNYFKNALFNYNVPSNYYNISDPLKIIVVEEGILFFDFVENDIYNYKNINKEKEIVIINEKGYYYKFVLMTDEKKIYYNTFFHLKESVQWI